MYGIIFVFLLILSFLSSKDVFSPAKIYLAVIFVFFGDSIFTESNNYSFQLIMLVVYLFSLIIMIFEKFGLSDTGVGLKRNVFLPRNIVFRIWLITLIPVIAQFLFISKMGGVNSYLFSIAERVNSWKGFGVYLLLIRLISVISYCYFFHMITHIVKKKHIYLFLVHFSIFVTLALLSGSRSMLLWNLVYMVVLYHFISKKISLSKALMSFGVVVFLAMILGALRDGYTVNESGFSSGLEVSTEVLNMANFTYGTKPIHLLLELNDSYEYSLGKTYITVFTNLIPRGFWPAKPDPGGIVFTRDILGDPFGGFSYYSTGIFGEAFINFGLIGGAIFAVCQLFILYLVLFLYISKLNICSASARYNNMICYYPFLLLGIPAYLYAEFTTNTLSMLFFKMFLFFLVLKFTIIKVKG
ncbi:hypothetical protein A1L58_08495 [Shewanella baltica]|uniref:O-antigen polymerase n=1 Tax=Shewanella baltica TaxID=62322 RepID=UPI0007B48862|nr:O-antigen polymerase [Shewanella baltica]KZK65183.1 hypothetical protein A1L58_08495 [Shewanella baltica]